MDMIIYTDQGIVTTSEKAKKCLQEVEDLMEEDIDAGKKITLEDMDREYFNSYDYRRDVDLEIFVNPSEWGYDRKGYRQLYQYVTKRIEL